MTYLQGIPLALGAHPRQGSVTAPRLLSFLILQVFKTLFPYWPYPIFDIRYPIPLDAHMPIYIAVSRSIARLKG